MGIFTFIWNGISREADRKHGMKKKTEAIQEYLGLWIFTY